MQDGTEFSNRFIQSFVKLHSSKAILAEMNSLFEMILESIELDIDFQKKLDMKSTFAILSTTVKNSMLNNTVEFCKDIEIDSDIVEILSNFQNPRDIYQEILLLVYHIQKSQYKNLNPDREILSKIDSKLLKVVEDILDKEEFVVKTNLDFELVCDRLFKLTMLNEVIDFKLANDFIMFSNNLLRKIISRGDRALVKILETSESIEIVINPKVEIGRDIQEFLLQNQIENIYFEIREFERVKKLVIYIYKSEPIESTQIDRAISKEEKMLRESPSDNIVSAIEYLGYIKYYKDSVDDLEDIEKEWEFFLTLMESANLKSQDFNEFGEVISKYHLRLLENFEEFSTIIYAFESLSKKMIELEDINILNERDMRKIVLLLQTLKDDISIWRKSIFLDASVDNIHYLDSSFLSSCMQIESILNQTQIEDDDIEFF